MAASAVAFPRASSDSARQQPSRFVEGSMNDRVSAKPPPDFIGPDLEAYERQFYGGASTYPVSPTTSREPPQPFHATPVPRRQRGRRYERPLSAEAQLYSPSRHNTSSGSRPPLTKKSSFFGRLKGAFGFGTGWGSAGNGAAEQQQQQQQQQTQGNDEVKRKHTSLQDQHMPPPVVAPPASVPVAIQQSTPTRPPARQWKSQSHINIPQFPGMMGMDGDSSDRPSREEILASYQQLMASGFFQAHAIQSTRQPAPHGVQKQQNATTTGPASTITAVPASEVAAPPPAPSRLPPPLPTIPSTGSNFYAETDIVSYEQDQQDSMDWQDDQESRYALRGRKRGRATDADDIACNESSLSQPLRKMAKKLRKIPSSLTSPGSAASSAMQVDHFEPIATHRVPSVSMGSMPAPYSDRQLRPRVASPAPLYVPAAATQSRTSRRSVSISSSIGGSPNKLQKRSKSPSPFKTRPPPVSRGGFEAAGIRGSMESARTLEGQQYGGAGSLKISRLRERLSRPSTPDPLATRSPQAFRNAQNLVPSVPRIPSIYKQNNVDISRVENTRPRGDRRFA